MLQVRTKLCAAVLICGLGLVIAGCGSDPAEDTAAPFAASGDAPAASPGAPGAPVQSTASTAPPTTLKKTEECIAYRGFATVSTYTTLNPPENKQAMIDALIPVADKFTAIVPDQKGNVDAIIEAHRQSIDGSLNPEQLEALRNASDGLNTWKTVTCL